MAGYRIPPRAMIVRPVAPVRAVKIAQVTRAMRESPPGNQPRIASVSLINLFGAPLSERRYPAKVKSGMATRMGVVAMRYISIIMAEESIWLVKKSRSERPAITTKRGAPRIVRMNIMIIKGRVIVPFPFGPSFLTSRGSPEF